MDRDDGPRPRTDGCLDLRRIHAERPRLDVDEDRHRSLVEHRHRRGDEGEGRDDDLVPAWMPAPISARCSAEVPLLVARLYREPTKAANSRSRARTSGAS
jgi:hypothetical protein